MSIARRIEQIRQEIPDTVRLIAVTKQVPVSAMREAYAAGLRDFAENRLQDALPKQAELQDLADLRWHFIGHLQTNKAQKAIAHFQWIHSVDSLKLAQKLDQLIENSSYSPQVCLQVKVLPDPDKYGWEITDLMDSLPALDALRSLQIRGLMAILPLGLSPAEMGDAFDRARELAQTIQQNSHLTLGELSMGMSGDYGLAIEHGATAIRLGRAIFGERMPERSALF